MLKNKATWPVCIANEFGILCTFEGTFLLLCIAFVFDMFKLLLTTALKLSEPFLIKRLVPTGYLHKNLLECIYFQRNKSKISIPYFKTCAYQFSISFLTKKINHTNLGTILKTVEIN